MGTRRTLVHLLLAATLLLGQWLAAGHDPDHGLQPGATHACAVCVYSHGAGAGAVPVFATLDFDFAAEVPQGFISGSPSSAVLRHHPIRGPPALLA